LQFGRTQPGCFYIANPQFIHIDAGDQTALRTQIPLLIHILVLSRSTKDDSIGNAHQVKRHRLMAFVTTHRFFNHWLQRCGVFQDSWHFLP